MMKRVTLIIISLLTICELNAQKITGIDNTQFEISPTSASFGAEGGTQEFTVTSEKEWFIDIKPTFGTLKRVGNKLRLSVGPNNGKKRNGTFIITLKNNRKITVKISQARGETPQPDPAPYRSSVKSNSSEKSKQYLNISSSYAEFGASGGSKTFTVSSSNDSWEIYNYPASWCHVSRSGNTFTLSAVENKNMSDRNCYLTVRSGDRRKDVNVYQKAARFEISSKSASFGENGGTQSFTVTSTSNWTISDQSACPGTLTRAGNTLTLKVNQNKAIRSKSGYFTIKSNDKSIRVDVYQSGATPYLKVNGRTYGDEINFSEYAGTKYIPVSTNNGEYVITGVPGWCYVNSKSANGFTLGCYANHDRYGNSGNINISANGKTFNLKLTQSCNYKKYWRHRNGGWVNMAIGTEGSVCADGEGGWTANGVVGVRFGNFGDVLQFEMGVTPGVIGHSGEMAFHMPAYGALKLSTYSGKFYLKVGGAYNVVREEDWEGQYSLRAGFGSAWKHFEWDWIYAQLNADGTKLDFDIPNLYLGMRLVWYITK